MGPLPVPAVSDALPKTYDPAGTESRWQQAWEASGAFHPDPAAPGEPFMVRPDRPHLRVTVGLVGDDADRLAEQLADAAALTLAPAGQR